MTDRATTLLSGRRERLERMLGRPLRPHRSASAESTPDRIREYLRGEAEDLYWNELEWENITDEEAMEEGPLTELAFPGLLAFVRGLLLTEVMPDSLAPATPRPDVVEDVLMFLARRVIELEEGIDGGDGDDPERLRTELEMTGRLVDLVLYRYHELGDFDVERVETEGDAAD